MANESVVYEAQPMPDEGLHALIIGVSEYPHLDDGVRADQSAASLDLGQLTSASRTALAVRDWLLANSSELKRPVASIRLLISPSAAEEDVLEASIADFSAIQNACAEWREALSHNKQGVGFFFFAGHGVARNSEDAVLLARDVNAAGAPVLDRAFAFSNVLAGMAPSATRPDIAETQLYFIDACRSSPDAFQQYDSLTPRGVFDPELNSTDDRCAPVFFAATGLSRAYEVPGDRTLFGKALLTCLDGGAADDLDQGMGDLRWGVTVYSLSNGLGREVERLKQFHGSDQEYDLGGRARDTEIRVMGAPPHVEVTLEVEPAAAAAEADLTVRQDGLAVEQRASPLAPHPLTVRWPAGYYDMAVEFAQDAPYAGATMTRPVVPPRRRFTFRVGKDQAWGP